VQHLYHFAPYTIVAIALVLVAYKHQFLRLVAAVSQQFALRRREASFLIDAVSDGALLVLLTRMPRSRTLLHRMDTIATVIPALLKTFLWIIATLRLPTGLLRRRDRVTARGEALRALLNNVLECLSFTEARSAQDVAAQMDRSHLTADLRNISAEQLESGILLCLRLLEAMGEAKGMLMARSQYLAQFRGDDAQDKRRASREFDRMAARYSELQQIYLGRPLVFMRLDEGGLRKRSRRVPQSPLVFA
jgi:hypothetical protein